MDPKRLIRVSKFLSRHLRHAPVELGVSLQPGGWVAVADLLAGCKQVGVPLTRGELEEVVTSNDKQRFAFDETGSRIRANQGHSVDVDLQLEPAVPPDMLFHGTSTEVVGKILTEGLRRMHRHHVHLSLTIATAYKVGSRHGKPVVFQVDAATMANDGFAFFRSANGVWLVDEVPPRYLRLGE